MIFLIAILFLAKFCDCSYYEKKRLDVRQFNLDEISLEPAPKPGFLINATQDAIEQFMAIYRTPGIAQVRKMTELDVLVGTLRTEVQQSYTAFKAESILLKLAQDERLQEVAEKAHYTIVHLNALRDIKMGTNERKARTEMMFSEFSDFVVSAVSDEVSNILDLIMRQMLRAILFTDKMAV
ncbi:unnamed protein product [Caenorhabditis angaria]|uniref:SXP/RAL-2 family protein Ani s 5-like cation-binding domain-containing protein n=1 Tax=Caenorhabditis angaria TaxID=860376 RepID=A0A9P1IH97_9PELO|nr:unnamed protein product [Caenorhabditis angaria]